MNYLDEIFGNITAPEVNNVPSVPQEQFSHDKVRAELVRQDQALIEQFMDGLEIPDVVKQMVTYNISTNDIDVRKPPTMEDKREALWNFWKFIDILDFHGGSQAFSDCHREMVSFATAPNSHFRQLILEPRGHLKAQPLTSKVLTPTGWKTIGELKVGDTVVCGETGMRTEVTHLHPISKMKLFKVTTADGRFTLCNEEHLWNVIIPSNRPYPQTLPLREIKENYLTSRFDKRNGKSYQEARYRIELVPAHFQHNGSLPIDPYTLGAWLGDGTSSQSHITSADPDIMDKCEGVWEKGKAYKYTNTHQGLKERLRAIGVLGNKHIPDAYKFSSIEQRRALLAGLMDTDGTPGVKSGMPSITQKSARLAADIIDLVRSLGGKATYSPVKINGCFYYSVQIRTPFNPFSLKRKADLWTLPKNYKFWTAITSIEEVEEEQFSRCITVGSPFGMYITDNFLPTHNSTLLAVAYSLWRIYQNPNIRIFVGTATLKLSTAFIREIEQHLTDDFNKEYIWNSRPHYDGLLIPEMDSIGKSRRSIVRDVASEWGEEYSTASASTKKKVWRAQAIQVVRPRVLKEPTITAGSAGQAVTGDHYDEIIFDDVVTYDNASSESKIQKVYSWIYDIESVLDPPYIDAGMVRVLRQALPRHFTQARRWAVSGGRLKVIGTRYNDMDYYGHIIENKDRLNFETHIRNIYRNGIDNSDGYRWPEKWNEAVEEQTKAQFETEFGSSGLSRYYSQYHNKIVSFEEAVLDWEKLNWVHPSDVKLGEDKLVYIYDRDHKVLAQFRPRLVIDPTATGSEKTSDFCAIAVGGVCKQTMYVIDFWMKKAKPEVWLKQMYEMIDKWNLYEVVIEMVGGFKVLEFAITQMWLAEPDKYRPISVKSYNPPTNTGEGKMQRIETILSPLLHNGLLYLPLSCSRNKELQKQFMFFGKETTKDDGVDVLAILKEMAHPEAKPKSSRKSGDLSRVIHGRFGGVVYDVPPSRSIEAELNAS